jgi:hypothetical protein
MKDPRLIAILKSNTSGSTFVYSPDSEGDYELRYRNDRTAYVLLSGEQIDELYNIVRNPRKPIGELPASKDVMSAPVYYDHRTNLYQVGDGDDYYSTEQIRALYSLMQAREST